MPLFFQLLIKVKILEGFHETITFFLLGFLSLGSKQIPKWPGKKNINQSRRGGNRDQGRVFFQHFSNNRVFKKKINKIKVERLHQEKKKLPFRNLRLSLDVKRWSPFGDSSWNNDGGGAFVCVQ